MRTEEEVVALFAEANPIPGDQQAGPSGSGSHVDAFGARRTEMTETQLERVERKGNYRRSTPWVVAAVVVSVVALATVIADLARTGDPVAGIGAWTASTTIDRPLDPAVETVHAFIAAFNERNIEAMTPLVSSDYFDGWTFRRIVDGELVEETANFTDLLFAMNTHLELLEPCVLSDEPNAVECHIRLTEDFHGPGFDNGDGVFTFHLDDAGLVEDMEDPTCCDRQFAYNLAFWFWLRSEHPSVYAQIGPTGPLDSGLPGYERAVTDMTTALEYLDEFVAQSPDYPIENP